MNELAGKKLKIYLDFDGTVVEHTFPKMGRCNFGCFEVIKKLQDAGHELILNTYRANISNESLNEAIELVNNHHWRLVKDRSSGREFKINPISSTDEKIGPYPLDFEEAARSGVLFIDDQSSGTPLKDACMSNGKMVDWEIMDLLFIQKGIYNYTT